MSRPLRLSRLVIAALIAATAAGCATEQPHRGRGHWREGGEARREGGAGRSGVSLFISPAGQPFRAAADDAYPVGVWFAAADADHDGKLTRSEFRADATRFFRQVDRNGDGVIDGAEVTAYEHEMVPEILGGPNPGASQSGQSRGDFGGGQGGGRHHGGMGGGRGGMGGSRGGGGGGSSGQAPQREVLQGAAPYTLNRQSEPVSAADANFDGKVTLEEFLASADRHFAELDTAGAGYLTLPGLPKTVAQERRVRRQASD